MRLLSSEVAKAEDKRRMDCYFLFLFSISKVCSFSILSFQIIDSATVRKPDAAARASLTDFGKYVADCLPKYVQKVQLTAGDELEVLIAPEGVIPTLQFLKDHHTAQFANLVDIAGMDVPSRKYRFEVSCR